MTNSGPTLRKLQLGSELRRLRVGAGKLIEDAAVQIACSTTKISRVETGQAPITARDVRDLLSSYGVLDPVQVAAILEIHRDAQQRGWWEAYDDVLPSGMSTYAGLESDTVSLFVYEPLLVFGLFQTEEYARAMIGCARIDPAEIDRLVSFRLERQEALTRSKDPLMVWAVCEESALRRPIGGSAIMEAQRNHLADLCSLPNVTIQVMPTAKGAHVGLDGGFTLLEFGETIPMSSVYVEGSAGNIYLQKPADVRRFKHRRDQLVGVADDPNHTAPMLRRINKENQ